MQELDGCRLFIYKTNPRLPAFIHGPSPDDVGAVVFIPGLTDGLLGLDYVSKLAKACAQAGFAFCQPILSSSYLGYGVSCLDKDAEEIDALLSSGPLRTARMIVIVGHSTGCQDAVHYLGANGCDNAGRVRGIVLQGAVSDREAMELEAQDEGGAEGVEKFRSAVESAAQMVTQGKGEDLMPRDTAGAFGTPITAARYNSLGGKGGSDDMFSSDLTTEELEDKLAHVSKGGCKVLLVFSGSDEYVPKHLRGERGEEYPKLAIRLCSAIGCGSSKRWNERSDGDSLAWWHVIENGTHGLEDPSNAEEFVLVVQEFLTQLKQQ